MVMWKKKEQDLEMLGRFREGWAVSDMGKSWSGGSWEKTQRSKEGFIVSLQSQEWVTRSVMEVQSGLL